VARELIGEVTLDVDSPAGPIDGLELGADIQVTVTNYSSFVKLVQCYDEKARRFVLNDTMQPWAKRGGSPLVADSYASMLSRTALPKEDIESRPWTRHSSLSNGDDVSVP
jgi:hypothetical protein